MLTKFTQSINIKRDRNRDFEYTVTSNSRRIYEQIINNFNIGIRSFNIIGTYGSGKSSFLLAFEKTLRKEKKYFKTTGGEFSKIKDFVFLPVIGVYNSFLNTIAKELQIEHRNIDSSIVLSRVQDLQTKYAKENKCLVLVVDEFGKFLEYAGANDPDQELYFIQQLAELFNDQASNSIFLSVLHQSFEAYSFGLTKSQRQEWEKVKGRLKDLTFNEPVEQLLHLASEKISTNNKKPNETTIRQLLNIVKKNNLFSNKIDVSLSLSNKLYPFDFISAFVLASALQTYGQNERSLFTFLESEEYLGFKSFDYSNDAFFDLSSIYDYLAYNYYSFLSTKFNPHYVQWNAIRSAVERTESLFNSNSIEASKIVKTIGLLNIFSSKSAKINNEFLSEYSLSILKIDNGIEIVNDLKKHKVIRHINFRDNFVLYEGTDLDIELSIEEAGSKINPSIDVVQRIIENFNFPFIPAKSVHYKYGTPRFFEFIISDHLINEDPKGEVDGRINLIFSNKINKDDLKKFSRNNHGAFLFGLYKNQEDLKSILLEIDKINWVIDHLADDQVALRELKEQLTYQQNQLNNYILNNLTSKESNITWIFKGNEISIKSSNSFNNILSKISEDIYCDIPVFKNELINREKIPSSISIARKKFFNQLLHNWSIENIGFDEKRFPPEKTIYLTLLKETGIHRRKNDHWVLGKPNEKSFFKLWEISNEFLNTSKDGLKNISEFYKILLSKPFKLKKGTAEFWIPLFLFIKREEYALFSEHGFVPAFGFETIELLIKAPKKFSIKAFDISGVKLDLFRKYQELINVDQSSDKVNLHSFIQIIKPFLVFYKDLPAYSKQTNRLSKSAINLRAAIANAQDPEETFFKDFPSALGYSHLDLKNSQNFLSDYILQLQLNIREIRTSFNDLINRIETNFKETVGYHDLEFLEYRAEIKTRYKSLKKYLLLPYQKVFYQRLTSNLDDRKAWIGSIVNAVLNKPFEKIVDEDEEFVYEKFSNIIRELDNLTDIAKVSYNSDKEDIVKIELTTIKKGNKFEIVRIPKNPLNGTKEQEEKIQALLGKNKKKNIVILTKILQNELGINEKN